MNKDSSEEPDFDWFYKAGQVMNRCLCGQEFKMTAWPWFSKCTKCGRERHYTVTPV